MSHCDGLEMRSLDPPLIARPLLCCRPMALAQLPMRAVLAALTLLLLQSAYSLIVRASHASQESQGVKYDYNTRCCPAPEHPQPPTVPLTPPRALSPLLEARRR